MAVIMAIAAEQNGHPGLGREKRRGEIIKEKGCIGQAEREERRVCFGM